MTDITELADRVEALTGPCKATDDAIASALFTDKQWTCVKGLSDEAGGMWMFRYPNGTVGSALRFTRSLDAAMTLVPRDCEWSVNWCGNSCATVAALPDGPHYGGAAETPALSLTAAALRARAALGDQP